MSTKYVLAIFGVLLIFIGGLFYAASHSAQSSVVTIGEGYINVESAQFVRSNMGIASNSGNKNVTYEEIATAFVGQVGSGDFKLHKNYGTNFGDTNVGIYTLGNGAKAHMATTNSTCLIIQLKNGEYLIVGNEDTQAIATSFSQNVYKLSPFQ
ncbi:MAG: hypothetical protein LBB87_03150 [Nitrososphaerota archaeon]|jgi:hypothetical protein|nr:hypothetical protein [Nitrososphaerota archaeon]